MHTLWQYVQYDVESILGPDAPGLSATNIVRLKRIWETEYKEWTRRDGLS